MKTTRWYASHALAVPLLVVAEHRLNLLGRASAVPLLAVAEHRLILLPRSPGTQAPHQPWPDSVGPFRRDVVRGLRVARAASNPHLDLGRVPYVVYGVKYIDPASLALVSGPKTTLRTAASTTTGLRLVI